MVASDDDGVSQAQQQRYERKYLFPEAQSLQMRDYVKHYLVPDEYSAGRPNYSYPVYSIYLDSDELMTYWATVHCEKNRFKLRLRYYDENPASPVFCETKRRVNECILKQRVAVLKIGAPLLVSSYHPAPEHLLSPKPRNWLALQKFCQLMRGLHARPKMHIAYQREAWMHPENNSVRLTMDREIYGEQVAAVRLTTQLSASCRPFGTQVLLELKYTDHFPKWFGDLVRHFNLVQVGAPKYCRCLEALGPEQVAATGDWNSATAHAWIQKYF